MLGRRPSAVENQAGVGALLNSISGPDGTPPPTPPFWILRMPHVAPSALEVSLKGAGGRRRGKAGGDTSVPKTSRKGGTGLLDSEPEFSAQGYQREGRLARTNT